MANCHETFNNLSVFSFQSQKIHAAPAAAETGPVAMSLSAAGCIKSGLLEVWLRFSSSKPFHSDASSTLNITQARGHACGVMIPTKTIRAAETTQTKGCRVLAPIISEGRMKRLSKPVLQGHSEPAAVNAGRDV
jgi:hypothetical protein